MVKEKKKLALYVSVCLDKVPSSHDGVKVSWEITPNVDHIHFSVLQYFTSRAILAGNAKKTTTTKKIHKTPKIVQSGGTGLDMIAEGLQG